MNFGYLEYVHKNWKDIRVIGKTIEHEDGKYHIMGMTLDEESAKIYIIEPCRENEIEEKSQRKRLRQRALLKEDRAKEELSYLHLREISLGKKKLEIQGGTGSSLKYDAQNYEYIKLFFDMMNAGWIVPEYLRDIEWEELRIVALEFRDVKRLPKYSKEMLLTIKHDRKPIQHFLEKQVTLRVGKEHTFSFTDANGEKIQCYINNVTLLDMWKEMEERFRNPLYKEQFRHSYEALEQECPKGMYYVGIEYECSKPLGLQFYTKEFLKSYPKEYSGSATSMLMTLKPEKETGTHGLKLRGAVIQTAVWADTKVIPAELFFYTEMLPEWEETV